MIARSMYVTMHLVQFDGGQYFARVSEVEKGQEVVDLLQTGYSSCSSLFQEVASLLDAITWSWCATCDPSEMGAATG